MIAWCKRLWDCTLVSDNKQRVEALTPPCRVKLEQFENVSKLHRKSLFFFFFSFTKTLRRSGQGAFAQVLAGTMPLVVHVNNADYIATMLRLQSTFNFSMVIVGGLVLLLLLFSFFFSQLLLLIGSEAWLVADLLAAANVPVIVSPPLCGPQEFFQIQYVLYVSLLSCRLSLLSPSKTLHKQQRSTTRCSRRACWPFHRKLRTITSSPLGSWLGGRIRPHLLRRSGKHHLERR